MHKGAKNNRTSKTTIPWIIPENGEMAPFLILVAVLAIAPVAGIPPNKRRNHIGNSLTN